ncbi:unnamed protein product [Vitrella brassicaformis CCMP3155]|uniref:Uncharacterized protein n=1 Tax=Vitrella brassicaformis (strain CCMP3155) TaxID=1169540 RepID=A0A0G4FLI3_VITBC|nr:unnamed protein product [Vitrella brassicaformis CCMP3155]|eukprot:CEM14869.1 unnamed protein product [Vitrella brassicaformis CCMP3155]
MDPDESKRLEIDQLVARAEEASQLSLRQLVEEARSRREQPRKADGGGSACGLNARPCGGCDLWPEAIDEKELEEKLTLLIAVFGHDLMRALTLVVQGSVRFTPLDDVKEWPKVMEMGDMVAVSSRLCVGNVVIREDLLNAFDSLAIKEIIAMTSPAPRHYIRECGVFVSDSEVSTSESTKGRVSRADTRRMAPHVRQHHMAI